MKRNRCGKIVATVGPACQRAEQLERLYLAGVDVFRLNFSHGTHENHAQVYKHIRELGKKYHTYPTILADLQGPKLRVGTFENKKILLEVGDTFVLDSDETPGNTRRVYFPHPEVLRVLTTGTVILLDDGKLSLHVVSCHPGSVTTRVMVGGPLSDHKGVNIPNIIVPIPALTEKDKADLEFALELGVDWIALSFVQSVEDVEKAKAIVNGRAKVLAKIEKPLAVRDREAIINAADGVMVARGDLGVEMSLSDVPRAQKNLIATAHRLGKPIIVATQMMESMIASPVPTRAEVSDVANAVYDGADATMFSAETATGKYGDLAVKMMSEVIQKTEADPSLIYEMEDECCYEKASVLDALCAAAVSAAICCSAKIIVLHTDSADAVAKCANMRPLCPILLVTSSDEIAGMAGMYRGVFATYANKEFDMAKVLKHLQDIAEDEKFVQSGDYAVVLDLVSEQFVSVHRI